MFSSLGQATKIVLMQVHYDNHRKFRRKDSDNSMSPVRIFTNIDLDKFILPSSEGYRYDVWKFVEDSGHVWF